MTSSRKIGIVVGLVLFALALMLIAGAVSDNPQASVSRQAVADKPDVIVESFNPTLDQFAPLWQVEIGRRFHHSVAILVHGGDFEGGRWIVGASMQPWAHIMTAQDLVRHVQAEYPDRTVVLLACNVGHLKLGIPGVYYAESSVWCCPDRAIDLPDITPAMREAKMLFGMRAAREAAERKVLSNRWQSDPDVVGNIFEFVSE